MVETEAEIIKRITEMPLGKAMDNDTIYELIAFVRGSDGSQAHKDGLTKAIRSLLHGDMEWRAYLNRFLQSNDGDIAIRPKELSHWVTHARAMFHSLLALGLISSDEYDKGNRLLQRCAT